MVLKQSVIEKIDNPITANKLGTRLNKGGDSIRVHIKRNKINGELTKLYALKAISEETGIDIMDICEEVSEAISQN